MWHYLQVTRKKNFMRIKKNLINYTTLIITFLNQIGLEPIDVHYR